MNSLEIVEERISTADKRNLLLVNLSKKELEQIKEDLKVFEIIKKLIQNGYSFDLLSKEEQLELFHFIEYTENIGDKYD